MVKPFRQQEILFKKIDDYFQDTSRMFKIQDKLNKNIGVPSVTSERKKEAALKLFTENNLMRQFTLDLGMRDF